MINGRKSVIGAFLKLIGMRRAEEMGRNESHGNDASSTAREALEEAKARILDLTETLKSIMTAPAGYAAVVALLVRPAEYIEGDDEEEAKDLPVALLATQNGFLEVPLPSDPKRAKAVKPGVVVRVNPMSSGIIGVVKDPPGVGEIVIASNPVGKTEVEFDFHGSLKVAVHGLPKPPEEGDRLVVDASGSIVLRSLGKEQKRHSLSAGTGVSWKDVGGLEEAKAAMIEAIEMPVKFADLYASYKKKSLKGVLLYGPPGCGKTLLAKAAASSISEIHGGKGSDTNFIYVKGPELLDKWVGNSEAQIRALFARAKDHKKKHGYPAILFIDEADALLGQRGSGNMSTLGQTIVPQFLSEMDGIEDSGALVLLSTNRPDVLDPAIVREGRIDRKVRVTRPDKKSAVDIFKIHLRDRPLGRKVENVDVYARLCAEALYSEEFVLYQISKKNGEKLSFTLANLVNGGMIAQFVEDAATLAVLRDRESGKVSGLSAEDATNVALHLFRQNRDLDHTEPLEEFVEPFQEEVANVRKFVASHSNGNGKAKAIEATT